LTVLYTNFYNTAVSDLENIYTRLFAVSIITIALAVYHSVRTVFTLCLHRQLLFTSINSTHWTQHVINSRKASDINKTWWSRRLCGDCPAGHM